MGFPLSKRTSISASLSRLSLNVSTKDPLNVLKLALTQRYTEVYGETINKKLLCCCPFLCLISLSLLPPIPHHISPAAHFCEMTVLSCVFELDCHTVPIHSSMHVTIVLREMRVWAWRRRQPLPHLRIGTPSAPPAYTDWNHTLNVTGIMGQESRGVWKDLSSMKWMPNMGFTHHILLHSVSH